MADVIWLDAVGEDDRLRVGGKAFVLGRLRQAGFPVPDGFVLPAGARGDDEEREAVTTAFARLGGPVAVRSSGTAEDGALASFAGQYLTVLDVHEPGGLLDAIARCREAATGASSYARTMGATGGGMAVLVQRFVEPQAAGVVFTRDPRDASRLLVEAHAGRGEAVVSGRVSPARYSVARENGATRLEGSNAVLDAAQVRELVSLAGRVEARLGTPQDIEWAWNGAGVVLLQARPITVPEAEAVDPRLRRLTRANVGEVLPGPVTPLSWSALSSFLESAFVRICRQLDVLPDDAPPFVVLHRRRVYFNLGLCIEIAMRLPGVAPEEAERLILGGGAMQGHGPALRAVPRWRTLAGVFAMSRTLPGRIEEAERIVAALPAASVIEAADAPALARMLESIADSGVEVAVTHVSTSGASGVTMTALARVLARDGRGDSMERTARLLAGLDGVESVAPALALETIAAGARRKEPWLDWLARPAAESATDFTRDRGPADLLAGIRSFLSRFGHRGLSEGDLSARSWDEDPLPVFESLQALMKSGRSPGFGTRARAEVRLADEEALFMRAGVAVRPLLRYAVRTAQLWVRRREHTKSLSIAMIRHVRRLVQASVAHLVANGALPDPSLIDFVTLGEIRAALGGVPLPLLDAQRRRRRHDAESRLPVPREIDLHAPAVVAPDPAADTGGLRGIGVSAGVAVGRARVVTTPSGSLEPGEILVTPVLDAGLAPLLTIAAGAVAEIGGILSHGSVVAREMGVPCVVDVRDATRRIADGETVIVDGGTGVIQVIREGAVGTIGATTTPLVTPIDVALEGLHPFADHPRARESVYFNMRDPERGLAVVFSMAVRPGGRGEALLTVSLPDGRVLFGLERGPAYADASGFRVGGFRLDWRPLRLTIDTTVAPHEGARFPPGPLPLLLSPPTVRLRGHLTLAATTPAVDFCDALSPEVREWLHPLGSHHIEQSGRWRGELEIDDQQQLFDGRGSRDHSWGIREWEAADYWRLFMAPIDDDLAVHALIVSARGRLVTGGFLWRNGQTELISRVEYAAERDAQGRPRSFELELSTASGPRRLRGTIEQTVTIPVDLERRLGRHLAGRPYRLLLHENFTRYEIDGAAGHGMAELTERPL